MQANIDTVRSLVRAQANNQGRCIPFLTALSGTGKTVVIRWIADSMDALYIPFIMATREPTEIQIPVVVDGEFRFEAGPDFRKANEAAKAGRLVIIHFDEFSTAMPAQQNAALTLLSEGRVGDMQLHPNVTFVVTQNPMDATLAGTPLSPAMANRAIHLEWNLPTAREWAEWVVTQRPNGTPEFKKLYALYSAGIAEFIKATPQLLHDMPEDDEARSGAWPSPRSWESAVLILAQAKADGLGEAIPKKLVAGCIGQATADKAWEYLIKLDLPNPEDILAGKASLPVGERMDKLLISINSLAQAAMEPREDIAARVVTALEAAEPAARTQLDYIKVSFRGAFAKTIMDKAFGDKALNPRITKVLGGPLAALAEAQATVDKA
jgi:hypothetical protein